MTTPTPAGAIWPARLAYTAAGIFVAASAGTNLIYGWQKGSDLSSSLVWAAVSLAVSIVFSLSWPALLRCLDAKQWSRAIMVLVALLITGGYSVTAAFGSAMGGRANAAMAEKDAVDRKSKAQASWDAAKAELDALVDIKPAADMQALIDNAKAELSKLSDTRHIAELEALMRRGCPAKFGLNGQVKATCPKYDTELARAWERQRVTSRIAELTKDIARAEQRHSEQREKAKAAMDTAAAELVKAGPARVANSDAVALAAYLQALGLNIDADRINKLLALLAVLVIECGGGFSLAVGMSLSMPCGQPLDRAVSTMGPASGHRQDEPVSTEAAASGHPRMPLHRGQEIGGPAERQECPTAVPAVSTSALDTPVQVDAGVQLLGLLKKSGGVLVCGQRSIAAALGWSKSWTNVVLHELARAGLVSLSTARTGTVVLLVPV